MTSGCLDRKEVRGAIWGVHSSTDRPASGNTGRLFLAFGGPVCADRISNCPLDRVLTYKNLIYLLNLQFIAEHYYQPRQPYIAFFCFCGITCTIDHNDCSFITIRKHISKAFFVFLFAGLCSQKTSDGSIVDTTKPSLFNVELTPSTGIFHSNYQVSSIHVHFS